MEEDDEYNNDNESISLANDDDQLYDDEDDEEGGDEEGSNADDDEDVDNLNEIEIGNDGDNDVDDGIDDDNDKYENAPNNSESDSDEDDGDDLYLQKFSNESNNTYLMDYHPECISHNYDEIHALTTVVRDKNGNIIDDLHKTIPYLTKYERSRILGVRAKQINLPNSKIYVKAPENIIDGYIIAEMELAQKRIPFIIKRPIFGGGCEYWNLKDLEIIN